MAPDFLGDTFSAGEVAIGEYDDGTGASKRPRAGLTDTACRTRDDD